MSSRISLEKEDLKFILEKISDNQTLCDKIKKQLEANIETKKTRQEIAKKASKVKENITRDKVLKTIEFLNANNVPLRIINILNHSDVAKGTAIKYLKEYKTLHNLH